MIESLQLNFKHVKIINYKHMQKTFNMKKLTIILFTLILSPIEQLYASSRDLTPTTTSMLSKDVCIAVPGHPDVTVSYHAQTRTFTQSFGEVKHSFKIVDDLDIQKIIKRIMGDITVSPWIESVAPLPNIEETLYLDVSWAAVTSAQNKCPVLMTNFVYNCVAMCLIDKEKKTVALVHIYAETAPRRISVIVNKLLECMNTTASNIEAHLISAQITPLLATCYSTLQQTGLDNITVKTLGGQADDRSVSGGRFVTPSCMNMKSLDSPLNLSTITNILSKYYIGLSIDARTLTLECYGPSGQTRYDWHSQYSEDCDTFKVAKSRENEFMAFSMNYFGQ